MQWRPESRVNGSAQGSVENKLRQKGCGVRRRAKWCPFIGQGGGETRGRVASMADGGAN
jgi:hypothetical protein